MLSSKQRQFLKGKAHGLKAIVQVGQKGLTGAVVEETKRGLFDHELIKVDLHGASGDDGERTARQETAEALAKGCDAEVVALVGKLVILYRPHPEKPRLRLPR